MRTIMRARFAAGSRLAAGIIAVLCAAAPAVAQQADDSTEFQSWQMPGWSFTPSIAIGAVHDSNVALSSPRASIGETQGDWLVNIVPAGYFEYDGKRTNFTAGYRGFLRRYAEVDGLDGFDQRATIGFRRAMTRRWSVFARNNFGESATTDEVEVNGVPFRRNGSRTNMTAAGASIRLSRLTTLATRYDMTWISFERPDELLAGGWIHGVRTDIGRPLTRRVWVGGEHAYRRASLDGGRHELSFLDAGGVVRFDLAPHTSASAAAGVGTLHDRSTDDRRQGPYVRLGVAHELPYATAGGSFERQYVPSFGFGGASSSQQLRAYATIPLAPAGLRRASAHGSLTWRRSEPFDATSLEADTIWIRSGVGFAVTRQARAEASYVYTRQDSIITGGEVDRHRIGIQFVISQPMRIH